MDIGNIPDKEFKVVTIKMLRERGRRLYEPSGKEMATHSSGLAWRILGMGEPSGLPSPGLHRVGHNWSYLAAVAAAEDVKKNQVELNNTITEIKIILKETKGLPWGLSSKESTC